jgi:predicted HTH domain antitoxin
MSISISKDLLTATQMTEAEINTELAVVLFAQERLRLGQASTMAGMNQLAFQRLLGSRGITIHYDVEEFEEDLATLKRLFPS